MCIDVLDTSIISLPPKKYFLNPIARRKSPKLYLYPIALRKAKLVYNFGLSECNRVKKIFLEQ